MSTLRHASDFFRVELDAGRRRVTITRLPRPFGSQLEAETACEPVLDVLGTLDRRRHVLLMDARDASGRNDAEYERWFAPCRRRIVEGFARVAVLVRTASGKLQASRLVTGDRPERDPVRVFTRLDEAERWLAEP